MNSQIIPLTSQPNQQTITTVFVDGANLTLQLNLSFNEVANYWVMDILNPSAQTYYLTGIPLLCGVYPSANLLAQYSYLAIGSAFIVNQANSTLDYPDANSLGTDFILLWGDTL